LPPRCAWAGTDPLYLSYHDAEWGVPVHEDQRLFEFILLEGVQAGLSWITILKKRENYRKALDGFCPEIIAGYGEEKIRSLLQDPGIVRNRLKIEAAVKNARAFLALREKTGSFDAYIWRFCGGSPIQNAWKNLKDVPPRTKESEAMSKDLKKQGFAFVGPTTCYAFMQAVGMVNDHVTSCFRHRELGGCL